MGTGQFNLTIRELCRIYSQTEVENWFKQYNLEDFLLKSQIQVIQNAGLWTKDKLAKRIVDFYYMREIGLETVTLFRHYAKIRMNEIMEQKLPLIYSNSIEYDPLKNMDYTEELTREAQNKGNASSNSNSNLNNNDFTFNSDLTQGELLLDEVKSGRYGSSASNSEANSNSSDNTNTNSESSGNEHTVNHVTGNRGVLDTPAKMIGFYRDNIITINKDIIHELSDIFMKLW